MNDEKTIQMDRMRFTKNTTSANLALLAILFNVLFFISIYESDKGSWYYTILVGASILYNLIFLVLLKILSKLLPSDFTPVLFLMLYLPWMAYRGTGNLFVKQDKVNQFTIVSSMLLLGLPILMEFVLGLFVI